MGRLSGLIVAAGHLFCAGRCEPVGLVRGLGLTGHELVARKGAIGFQTTRPNTSEFTVTGITRGNGDNRGGERSAMSLPIEI